MQKSLESLRAQLERASATFAASQCQILAPGSYQFVILEAREEYDEVRKYDYWYLKLDCGDKLTSDRFPIVDNMLWKINQLLAAIGLDIDSLSDVKQLVGNIGEFIAKAKGQQTFYKHQPKFG
jgi:hypothetical protein